MVNTYCSMGKKAWTFIDKFWLVNNFKASNTAQRVKQERYEPKEESHTVEI